MIIENDMDDFKMRGITLGILSNIRGYPTVREEVEKRNFDSDKCMKLFYTLVDLPDRRLEAIDNAFGAEAKRDILECFDIWLTAADEDDSEAVIEAPLLEIREVYAYLKERWAP